MPGRRYHIIFNPAAGTALSAGITTALLSAEFEQAGLNFTIDDDDSQPLEKRIARALDGDAEVVVAAGGDGTVLAVAAALIDSPKTLAVLPLGTLNGLARDLGLALDLKGAVAQLEGLVARPIDVGEVNGKPFLHNVIIGLIPDLAIGRELIRGKPGLRTKVKFLQFLARRATLARRIALVLKADDTPSRIEMVQTLVVANNSYDQRIGGFMARRRLDRGTMTAYLIRSFRVGDMVRLALEMVAGRWRQDEVIEFEKVRELTVNSKRNRVLVTMDGEITRLQTPLQFRVLPRSLNILAPAEPATETSSVAAAEPALQGAQ